MDEINLDLTPISDSVNTAANSINSSVKGIKGSVDDVNKTANAINNSVSKEIEGIDLIEEEAKDVNNQLKQLGKISELVAQVLNSVNKLYTISIDEEGNPELNEKSLEEEEPKEEEEEEFTYELDVGIKEPSGLTGLSNFPSLVGNGFALLANTFKEMQDNMVSGFSDLTKALIQSQTPILNEKKESGSDDTKSKASLSSFLQSMAGPLESIASGLLVLTVAIAAMKVVNLDEGLITLTGTLVLSLGILFAGLNEISKMYNENKEYISPESDSENSIIKQIRDLGITIGIITGVFIAVTVTMNFLKENVGALVLGLVSTVSIMGIALLTLKGLSMMTASSKEDVGEESNIAVFFKDFSKLILIISGTAILASFVWPAMARGAIPTMAILGLATATLAALMAIANRFEGADEQMENLSNILKSVNSTIITLSVLTIVLGLIPTNVLIQGLISVTLLVTLTTIMIDSFLKEASKITGDDKIKQLTGFMISLTVLLAIETAMVLVLGNQPIETLIKGFASITLMIVGITIATKLLSKIDIDEKVFGTLAELSLISLLMGATAFVVATMFTKVEGGPQAVMLSALGIVLVAGAFVLIGFATLALAVVGGMLMGPQIAAALVGIAIVSLASITLALAAAGIVKLWEALGVKSEVVMEDAKALMLIALAFVSMATAVITLAALAIPLLASYVAATVAVATLIGFTKMIVNSLTKLSTMGIGEIDIDPIVQMAEQLTKLAGASTLLVASVVLLSQTLGSLIILLPIVALQLPLTIVSLKLLSAELIALSAIEVPTDSGDKLSQLNEALKAINDSVDIIDGIKTIPLKKQLELSSTISYLNKLPEKLKFKSAESKSIDNLREFAQAVNELSQSGAGLEGLANNLSKVIKEASELNKESSINVKSSAESISKMSTKFESLADVKISTDTIRVSGTDRLEKKVDDLVSLFREVLKSVKSSASMAEEQVHQTIIQGQSTLSSKFGGD